MVVEVYPCRLFVRRKSSLARADLARAYPVIDLGQFALPKPANPVSGQGLVLDPAVDGVHCYPEMNGDLVDRMPAILIRHVQRSESASIGYCDRKSG
jgi:hypothetical protein